MISELIAAKAQPLLTSAIATLMEDHAHLAASVPRNALAQAVALRTAGRDVVALAEALEVLLRRAAEDQ